MPCSYKASEKETKHTTPLSKGGERGVKCRAATKQAKKKQSILLPSPLGEGLGVRPVVGVRPVMW